MLIVRLLGLQVDDLGSHIATQDVQLAANWISGDGDSEGIAVDANGAVLIQTIDGAQPAKLQIDAPAGRFSALDFLEGGSGVWGIGKKDAADHFYIDEFGVPTSRIFIEKTTGNVGIGLEAPNEKLDVAGKVRGTELCIGADCRAVWPSSAADNLGRSY